MQPEALIRQQIAELDVIIADLERQLPELAYEDAVGTAGAPKRLAAHLDQLETARSRRAVKEQALSVVPLRAAEAERQRIEKARARPPAEVIKGITARRCPQACQGGVCALAGGLQRCMHPSFGGIPVADANDRVLRTFQSAAMKELQNQAKEARYGKTAAV